MHLPIAICRNKNLHKFENRLLHITCQLQLAPFIHPCLLHYWIFWLKLEVQCDILYCVTYPISVTDRRCLYGFIHHFTRSCPGRRDDAHHLPMDGREMVTVNQDFKNQDIRSPGRRNCRGFSCSYGFAIHHNSLLEFIIAYAIIDCNMQK